MLTFRVTVQCALNMELLFIARCLKTATCCLVNTDLFSPTNSITLVVLSQTLSCRVGPSSLVERPLVAWWVIGLILPGGAVELFLVPASDLYN